MLDFLNQFYNPQFLVILFTTVAVFATVVAIAVPYFSDENLGKRIKAVSSEREKMRAARLEQLDDGSRGKLKQDPKTYMVDLVQNLNLRQLLETEDTKNKLAMAGYRGQAPIVAFLFFRFILPIVTLASGAAYIFFVNDHGLDFTMRLGVVFGAGVVGFYLPNIFISNLVQKRQQKISNAFPDALDLLLICVQSGLSAEAAFAKVAMEMGTQSVELAEELSLTTAELSYLPERRKAYENLGMRTGLPGVKAVCASLIQAERYGTPLAQGLKVMAQENRDMRMAAAEKKAAALPPKLTVPMITFFLPVLFVVILGPAVIKIMNL